MCKIYALHLIKAELAELHKAAFSHRKKKQVLDPHKRVLREQNPF